MKKVIQDNEAAPDIIQSDNGTEFMQEFDAVLSEYNTKHIRSRPYNPQANGQIERFNGTLKRMIYAHMTVDRTKTYIDILQQLVDQYNDTPHTTTKLSPRECHNGAQQEQAKMRIRDKAIKAKAETERRYVALRVGDHVRVAQGKKSLRKALTHWSREIYTIENISRVTQPWQGESYRLSNGYVVTRDRLQRVDMERLVRIPQRESVSAPVVRPIPAAAPTPIVRPPSQRRKSFNVRLAEYVA